MVFARRALVFVGVVTLTSCGEGNFFREAPKLVLMPAPDSTIDFGRSGVGGQVDDAPVTATNEGNTTLMFSSIRVDDDDRILLLGAPDRLGFGETASMTLRLEPNTVGPIDAALVLGSNDPDLPEARLSLVGEVAEGCVLRFAPSSARFEMAETKTFELRNDGAETCRVRSLDTDDSRLFGLVETAAGPFELGAGEVRSIAVRHTHASFNGTPVRSLVARSSGAPDATAVLVGEERTSCLSLSDERLEFVTAPGGRMIRATTLESTCPHDVNLTGLAISSAADTFTLEDDMSTPLVVPPGGAQRIGVAFDGPVGPNSTSLGLLAIETDDPADGTLEVPLEGLVARPQAWISPLEMQYDDVVYDTSGGAGSPSVCASPVQHVLVVNVGLSPLTVHTLELSGPRDHQLLSVEVDGTRLSDMRPPIEIPVQTRAKIALWFRPTGIAEQAAELRIGHDGADTMTSIPIRGRGVSPEQIVETFVQRERETVDILWAIDASCSMGEEQQRLIDNLSQFVGIADAMNADYQMAVTEAQAVVEGAGVFERCLPHPAVISSDYMTTEVRDSVFACMFALGINGVAVESGLGAARRAIERAMLPAPGNPNAGFLRNDADLAIVVISDEDDQSPMSDVALRDFFLWAKGGQQNRVAVHAIAGPTDNSCAEAAPGDRYADMVRQTGGRYHNICSPDWSPLLRDLGTNVFTPERWRLRRPPSESTIVVTVDGVAVPNDAAAGWTYVASSQEIVFSSSAVPPPGAQIVVLYTTGCAGG